MQLANSTSMITNNEFQVLSIEDIVGDSNTLSNIHNGTLIYTELYPAKAKKAINGKLYLPEYIDFKGMRGSLVWVCPIQKVFEQQTKNDTVHLSSLEIENKSLYERVAKLEAQAYTLQTEKTMLQLQILGKAQEVQELSLKLIEKVKAMEVYRNRPVLTLLGLTFILMMSGLVLLFENMLKAGAVFSFTSLTMLFISLYTLWRLCDIAVIKPRLMAVGFCASIGLLVTGISSIFM